MGDATTAQATPGPWFQFEGKPDCVGGPHPENGTAGTAMCGMRLRSPAENAANAALIVRACNAHAELVALLAEAVAKLPGWAGPEDTAHDWWARATIALARAGA
jgi:hypothetical protein